MVTFFPHPAAILRGRNLPYYLSSPEEKAKIFEHLGIDVVITHPFNREVANKSAREFILGLKWPSGLPPTHRSDMTLPWAKTGVGIFRPFRNSVRNSILP